MSQRSKLSPGPLAFVGGAEWNEGCSFDGQLIESSKAEKIVVIPTAAAYEFPQRSVDWATRYFKSLDVAVEGVMILARPDAFKDEFIDKIKGAKFIYLSGGSPMHLRSVLKATPALAAIKEAWLKGAVLAGSSAGGMVLTDPMSDPRGGALTLGLGLIKKIAFVPHFDTWDKSKEQRTVSLASGGIVVAGVDERTALIRERDGTWRTEGVGGVKLFASGSEISASEREARIEIPL